MLPVAQKIAELYGLGDAQLECINHQFNSTFKVVDPSGRTHALRINLNSTRTLENLRAEVFWVCQIATRSQPKVPAPVANLSGDYITTEWHPELARHVNAVLFEWLDGSELGDEPTQEQLRATGRALAQLHEAARGQSIPAEGALDRADELFWGSPNHFEVSPLITTQDRQTLESALEELSNVIANLYARQSPQLIHADVHPWNVMWQGQDVAIFDFDDCMIGLPVQDLSISLYYLDTEEQEQALLDGYRQVRTLPDYTEFEMRALKLHRRILLLNYLLETQNPEHREMIPEYLAETLRRIAVFMESR